LIDDSSPAHRFKYAREVTRRTIPTNLVIPSNKSAALCFSDGAAKNTELPTLQSIKNTEMIQKAITIAILLILSSANAFSTVTTVNKKSIQSSPLFQQQSHKHVGRRSAFEHSRTSSTELKLGTVPVGAFAGILTGGLFAGGLHAIAGKSTE
jgi:hypothetical protein